MLNPEQRAWKRRSFLLCILYFVAGYFLCGWLVSTRIPIVLPLFAWERALPFVPEAIWGYLLPYPVMLATYWVLDDFPIYRRFAWRYVTMLSIHLICYLLLPATIDRPPVTPHSDLSVFATALYYAVDPPRNLFPSFHVALPLLCTLCTWPHRRILGTLFFCATLVVAAAVLLVKQHYAIDVLGALGTVWLAVIVHRQVQPSK